MSYLNRVLSGVSLATLAALVAIGLLAAPPAQADELSVRPTVELFEEFSTNPTRARDRDLAEEAFALRYKPSVEIETRGAKGFNRFHLGISGRKYHESKLSNRDANDRFADFEFQRTLTKRLSFFGSAGYYFNEDVDAILVENEGTVEPGDMLFLTADRPDIETISGQLGMQYALSPRSSVQLAVFSYDFDYDIARATEDPFDPFRNRRDFTSNLASFTYNRVLGPRDTGFVQVSYRKTDFDPAAVIEGLFGVPFIVNGQIVQFITLGENTLPMGPGQEDDQYSITVGWSRQWTPTIATSIRGGTVRLRSEQDAFHQPLLFTVPGEDLLPFTVQGARDGRSSSFTGGASLTKTFKRGRLDVFASRETRPSSNISASIDETTYGFTYSHRFSSRLSTTVGVRNEFQEAANDNGFDDTARIRRYDASVNFRVRQRWLAFVRANSSRSKADNLFFNSYSDHRVSAGFRYAFDVEELDLF